MNVHGKRPGWRRGPTAGSWAAPPAEPVHTRVNRAAPVRCPEEYATFPVPLLAAADALIAAACRGDVAERRTGLDGDTSPNRCTPARRGGVGQRDGPQGGDAGELDDAVPAVRHDHPEAQGRQGGEETRGGVPSAGGGDPSQAGRPDSAGGGVTRFLSRFAAVRSRGARSAAHGRERGKCPGDLLAGVVVQEPDPQHARRGQPEPLDQALGVEVPGPNEQPLRAQE